MRGELRLVPHRHRALRGLAQRCGQVDRHALQRGVHYQFGDAVAHTDLDGIRRASLCVPGQSGERPQRFDRPQPFGGGRALRAHLHRRFQCRLRCRQSAHAAFEPHVAPQRLALHAHQRKAHLGKLHRTLGLRDFRHIRRELHIVARQLHIALHLRVIDVVDRQAQLQLEVGIAVDLGGIQRVLRELRDMGLSDQPQHVGERSARVGIDPHHGMFEVGNLRAGVEHLHLRQPAQRAVRVVHVHARAVKHQLAGQPGEHRPGQLARWLDRGWHIGVIDVLHLRGNAELAQPRLAEREVMQIALDAELHLGGHALGHRVAHIVAREVRNAERQIAVHARAIGARRLARQLQHAGKARAGR